MGVPSSDGTAEEAAMVERSGLMFVGCHGHLYEEKAVLLVLS
jgi:hypothetical protein